MLECKFYCLCDIQKVAKHELMLLNSLTRDKSAARYSAAPMIIRLFEFFVKRRIESIEVFTVEFVG